MAGRGTVILEEFSHFQLDFSPLPGKPQIPGEGLREEIRRIKLKSCRAGQRLNLDLEQAGQADSE
jgi:hypothetical protein